MSRADSSLRLGIFAKTFAGSDPELVLRSAVTAGFHAAHYNMACSGLASMPDEVTEVDTNGIAAAVQATGVTLCGLSATYNMIHPNPRVRESGLRQLALLAAVAQKLSIKVLTLCTGTRDAADQWRHHPDNQSAEAWHDLLINMEMAVAIAARHDILLGIEPELANVVNSPDAALRLLTEMQSDRIGIVIDPANLFHVISLDEQRRIVADAVDRLAPHLIMAHAKDRNGQGQPVAAGQGIIDFSSYFRLLRNAGFDGAVVTHGLAADEAESAFETLRRAADNAGFEWER